jgi:hypothetical protein
LRPEIVVQGCALASENSEIQHVAKEVDQGEDKFRKSHFIVSLLYQVIFP